jgi:CRISPR-associated protein Csb2
VRRLVVSVPAEEAGVVGWLRQALSGRELIDEGTGEAAAMLSLLSDNDEQLRRNYLGPSATWSTVTPVLLPGRHAETAGRVRRLLRHAFGYVGWPEELMRRVEFEWRDVGYRAGVDLSRRYRVPESLGTLPRLHVRVRFPVPVRGPLAVGAGCYRGLGVFATEDEADLGGAGAG